MANELVRKLTIKSCGFGTTEIKTALGDNKSLPLLKIAGVTTSAQPGQTDKGEYVKLLGQFRAVNLVTGETFDSAQCILPNFITEPLAAAVAASSEVEFGIEIGVKANATSVTGYEYTVKPLIEAKVSDKMGALLEASGMNAPLTIAAPDKTEEKTAKTKKA